MQATIRPILEVHRDNGLPITPEGQYLLNQIDAIKTLDGTHYPHKNSKPQSSKTILIDKPEHNNVAILIRKGAIHTYCKEIPKEILLSGSVAENKTKKSQIQDTEIDRKTYDSFLRK